MPNALIDLDMWLHDLSQKAAANTEYPEDPLRAYYRALGEFASVFAETELLVFFVLRRHTRTTGAVARAVFSGVRTDQTLAFLSRLAEVGSIDPAEWAELKPVLGQLKIINACRNQILHYGAADMQFGQGTVSNETLALTIERIQRFPISAEILNDMTADLRKIMVHFLMRHMPQRDPTETPPILEQVLAASWRYTPPPQSQNHSTRREKRPRRARPR